VLVLAWALGATALLGRPASLPYPPAPADGADVLLWADPLDPAPLGERTPLVMTHGFRADHQEGSLVPSGNPEFARLRTHPGYRRLFARYKPYLFSYRPWRSYPDLGGDLADLLHARFLAGAPAGRSLVLLGVSGGALPTRYAAADPRVSPHVAAILTLAGANRGSAASSVVSANARIKQRIGRLGWFLLKKARGDMPVGPCLRSLSSDNADGAISARLRDEAGLLTNPELRAFNEADPNLGKLICYFGRRRLLLRMRSRMFGIDNQLHRGILKKISRAWRTADPLVTEASALLPDLPVGARRVIRGVDHYRIATSRKVLAAVFEDLEVVARAARARRLHARRASSDPGA
jgi:hypothetical protein